jgi:hypothetical protein
MTLSREFFKEQADKIENLEFALEIAKEQLIIKGKEILDYKLYGRKMTHSKLS